MFREKIDGKQLGSWCFTAMVPMLVRWTSGYPWPVVAAVAVASGVGAWILWGQRGARADRLWILRASFAVVAVGVFAGAAARCWPGDNAPGVPLILLALAAWSAGKGPSAAARVGCVLFWSILGLYLLVLATAAKEVRWQWMEPAQGPVPWMGVAVASLPGAAVYMLRRGERSVRVVAPVCIAVAASLVTAGVISPWVAAKVEDGFYEMTRSLELLGVARRFEAVLSAGMTVGAFGSLTLLLSVVGEAVEWHLEGRGRIAVYIAAAAAGLWVLLDTQVPAPFFGLLGCLLWTIVPLVDNRKTDEEKAEKGRK